MRKALNQDALPPPLHPILAALTIVMDGDEDLAQITRSHPKLNQHKYYDPRAEFDDDLSEMLPGPTGRWWERLGRS